MTPAFVLIFLPIFMQDNVAAKPAHEFEITTQYELKRKPATESSRIVFEIPEQRQKESGTDLLPYLIIHLKVKRWSPSVDQVRIIDSNRKMYLKKKPNEEGHYTWDMGYVDDIKDNITPGKFFVQFFRGKSPIEQITVQVEADGTFLVNGAKRGKF